MKLLLAIIMIVLVSYFSELTADKIFISILFGGLGGVLCWRLFGDYGKGEG